VQDLHQGALAGAILAQQRMHLPRSNLKIDRPAGDRSAELFCDCRKLAKQCVVLGLEVKPLYQAIGVLYQSVCPPSMMRLCPVM
jgi:hypothetical protein